MQTFLPSTSFEQSAKWLDTQRLGCQRVECYQILKALTDPGYGWQNHPCVNMWRGYEYCLAEYGLTMCVEWMDRGYRDNCRGEIILLATLSNTQQSPTQYSYPPWLTSEFASNHRAILLGKAWEKHLDLRYKLTELAILTDGPVSNNPQFKKLDRQDTKATKVLQWYRAWDWTETPATRTPDGRWDYLWLPK